MLLIENLNVFYGGIHALKDVTLKVEPGEIVSIIGSNGAGKSTLMRTISGLKRSASGGIFFKGDSISESPADQIVRMGISQSPEGRRIFTDMTVQENLQLGAYIRKDADIEQDYEGVLKRFPRLRERFRQRAGTLSGGEQQMLAIGRALMAKPTLLLLDEPSLGLAPNLVQEIFRIIVEINEGGTTILLVEQNAHRALEIAARAYVLETGKVVMEGPGSELLHDSRVKDAYLGG
ncbi:MAG: ABC transporter ATP-binding protein [Fimbriimonadaceae bacterium]